VKALSLNSLREKVEAYASTPPDQKLPKDAKKLVDALLTALEAALLEAKRRGGNRLCVFQQEGFIYTPTGDDGS